MTADVVSPLELLLPEGVARKPLLLGSACPAWLLPGASRGVQPGGMGGTAAAARVLSAAPVAIAGGAGADLAILAPTVAECRIPGWLSEAADELARALAPAGLVYVLAPRRWRWRTARLLRRVGLLRRRVFLHTPDGTSAHHYLLPLRRAPMEYALSTFVAVGLWKRRLTQAALRLPGGEALLEQLIPSIAFVAGPPEAGTGAAWLSTLSGPPGGQEQAISVHVDGIRATAVVHVFSESQSFPLAVAKLPLSPPAVDRALEWRLLAQLGPAAERAGARVPRVVHLRQLGRQNVLVETPLHGRPMSAVLRERPADHLALLDQVVRWLARWNALTAAVQPLTSDWLNQHVLDPLDRAGPLLDGSRAYRAWVTQRCASLVGLPVPFVATHHDLSVANILLDRRSELGIVDWEMASSSDLPLLDFFYLATETTAALDNYQSWLAAFASCFAPDGHLNRPVMAFQERLVRALDLPVELVELCLHMCWIRRTARDLHQPRTARDLPFVPILQRLASRVAADRPAPAVGVGTGR